MSGVSSKDIESYEKISCMKVRLWVRSRYMGLEDEEIVFQVPFFCNRDEIENMVFDKLGSSVTVLTEGIPIHECEWYWESDDGHYAFSS